MTTHSSIFAWETPWTEKPGELQSTWLQRVRHDSVTERMHTHTHTHTHRIVFTFLKRLFIKEANTKAIPYDLQNVKYLLPFHVQKKFVNLC